MRRIIATFTLAILSCQASLLRAETACQITAPESPPIFMRGDGVVSQLDMDVYLARIPEHHRPAFLDSRQRLGEALENLVLPRQFVAEARVRAPELFVEPLLRGQLYQGALVLVAERYMDHLWEQQRLDDYSQQARELWLTHPELLELPAKISFSHILVQTGQARSEIDAMRRILHVYDLIEQGSSITELADEFSDDQASGENNGRYDEVDIDSLDGRVVEMVRTLEPGELSQPFRSQYGWHIVALHDRHHPDIESFEQIQAKAKELAKKRHETRFRESVLRRFYSEPSQVVDGAVEKLLKRYPVEETDLEKIADEIRQKLGAPQR